MRRKALLHVIWTSAAQDRAIAASRRTAVSRAIARSCLVGQAIRRRCDRGRSTAIGAVRITIQHRGLAQSLIDLARAPPRAAPRRRDG